MNVDESLDICFGNKIGEAVIVEIGNAQIAVPKEACFHRFLVNDLKGPVTVGQGDEITESSARNDIGQPVEVKVSDVTTGGRALGREGGEGFSEGAIPVSKKCAR